MNHWSTPVHYSGYFYGMFGQGILNLKCVEASTGSETWSTSGFGYGSVLLVENRVLALTDSGELVLVDPNPAAYTELQRFRALNGKCWNVPAISNGRLYVRSTTEAVCLDVAPKASPKLKLQASFSQASGAFHLLLGNEDGSPVESVRVPKLEILTTSDLTVGTDSWDTLTNSLTLINGQLRSQDLPASNDVQRFFIARERP
jgi:hypothetical protein